jgi:hypothetical protein
MSVSQLAQLALVDGKFDGLKTFGVSSRHHMKTHV